MVVVDGYHFELFTQNHLQLLNLFNAYCVYDPNLSKATGVAQLIA